MARAYCLMKMSSGTPSVDFTETPIRGYVLCDQFKSWGAYMVSGTAAQLTALNSASNVIGICAVTALNNTIAAGVRSALNAKLDEWGYPNIPAGWSYRQVLAAVYKRLNGNWRIDNFDVIDN